jgi:hypothetical protein
VRHTGGEPLAQHLTSKLVSTIAGYSYAELAEFLCQRSPRNFMYG